MPFRYFIDFSQFGFAWCFMQNWMKVMDFWEVNHCSPQSLPLVWCAEMLSAGLISGSTVIFSAEYRPPPTHGGLNLHSFSLHTQDRGLLVRPQGCRWAGEWLTGIEKTKRQKAHWSCSALHTFWTVWCWALIHLASVSSSTNQCTVPSPSFMLRSAAGSHDTLDVKTVRGHTHVGSQSLKSLLDFSTIQALQYKNVFIDLC